jgi:DNA invertase Pin-like site-specific DNA recombinase
MKKQEISEEKKFTQHSNYEPEEYAYARVSDSTQNINRQLDFFRDLGIEESHIFTDHQTGKDFNRPGYKKLLRKLKPGDILYVKELDRLGRDKEEIKEELNKLQTKKVRVKISNIPTTMMDYGEADLIMDMVNNILIEVLAAIAEQERITNHQRQAEGIAAARARGVHLGRPTLTLPDNFEHYYNLWVEKKMPRAEILDILQIDKVKWQSYCRSYKNRKKSSQKKDV